MYLEDDTIWVVEATTDAQEGEYVVPYFFKHRHTRQAFAESVLECITIRAIRFFEINMEEASKKYPKLKIAKDED